MVRIFCVLSPSAPYQVGSYLLSEGTTVNVLEDDDGSGWVKVADGSGGRGLIPASYIEPIDDTVEATTPRSSTPTAVSFGQGSGEYGQ